VKLGLISDTHDYLDPKIAKLFKGVQHILHAGDIGKHALLAELELIAPVTAVAGNTDDPVWGYPLTQRVTLAGRKFLVHHIVDPHSLHDDLKTLLASEPPDVIVFGHTHKPFCEHLGNTLFFNPGYAGRQRFDLARSVALMEIVGLQIRHQFIML
jgi:putative phosphoesterase